MRHHHRDHEAMITVYADGCSGGDYERHIIEETIADHVLLYVSIGEREVGVRVTPNGKVSIWVHDDSDEGPQRFDFDPFRPVDEPPPEAPA